VRARQAVLFEEHQTRGARRLSYLTKSMVGEANGGDVEGGGVALCVPRLSSGVASAGAVVLPRFASSRAIAAGASDVGTG
jgi:hypothetical protein